MTNIGYDGSAYVSSSQVPQLTCIWMSGAGGLGNLTSFKVLIKLKSKGKPGKILIRADLARLLLL